MRHTRGVRTVMIALLLGLTVVTGVGATDVMATTTMPGAQDDSGENSQSLEDIKKEAKAEISDYGDIIKLKADEATGKEIDKAVKKYQKIIGTADQDKNTDGLTTRASVEDCVTEAKSAIEALITTGTESSDGKEDALPSSTSEFVMVGGNWVTPTATHGQLVDIVLPVVNMGMVNLANVTVTPVISNTVSEWPFVIDTSGYTQTIADLPGKGNGQSDMDRRRELTWTLRTREDAMSGYYKLQFNVLYYVGTEAKCNTYYICAGKGSSRQWKYRE